MSYCGKGKHKYQQSVFQMNIMRSLEIACHMYFQWRIYSILVRPVRRNGREMSGNRLDRNYLSYEIQY